jgi:hypothetical protein
MLDDGEDMFASVVVVIVGKKLFNSIKRVVLISSK